MTPKERILSAIKHEQCDTIPTDMWATPEVQEMLFEHFGIEAGKKTADPGIELGGGSLSRGPEAILKLWKILGIDGIFHIAPPYIGPERKTANGISYNEWGFGYKTQKYGTGEYKEQVVWPMADISTPEEVVNYPWPDPDWYDYEWLPKLASRCEGRALACGYSAVFFYHNLLRGLELSLVDPVLNPEITSLIIAKLTKFFMEYHTRCFKELRGLAHITQVTDDFGSQNGLLISPQIFRDFYKEPMQRLINLAKSYGLFVFHHDDGDCRLLVPELVDMGIDILNPIQWRCGDWDLAGLKRDFGDRVCFHSAVDNQITLAFGTPAEVKQQVKMLIDRLYTNRTGFILGPCHNLQPNTSVENIVALYEAAK
ncbi:MAG: uroporphyrinogen decarboxylase family protein [Chloroflexota bacterium]